MKQDKKGIIFTIDAILALISGMILLSSAFFYLSQSHSISWVETDLSQLGMDSLAALEVAGNLNWTMNHPCPAGCGWETGSYYNMTDIEEFCGTMFEPHVCGQFRIYNASESNYVLMLTYTVPNCTLATSTKSATSRRIFVVPVDEPLIAEMEVWYK